MRHTATIDFWEAYDGLPESIKTRADACFTLLKSDERHPSLHFKKVPPYWSVRIGLSHRALATLEDGTMVWFWIGSHAEYDKLLAQ